MAEVLGVVASGIAVTQLASQVASNIVKLKNYWGQIKDAPAEIEYLLREIDALNHVLSHIQQDQVGMGSSSVNNTPHLEQSLELCQQGAEELGALVFELAKKVDGKHGLKQKLGSAKVVLKKDELKRLKSRLKSAVRLLSLSYQCHTSAMMQLQSDVLFARISSHITSNIGPFNQGPETMLDKPRTMEQTPTTKDLTTSRLEVLNSSVSWTRYVLGNLTYRKRYHKNTSRRGNETYARYKFPCWISYMAWEYHASSTLHGWQITLQTCRFIGRESPFFKAVRLNDVVSVRKMLLNREAFVTDRDNDFWGSTALHSSAENGHLELSQLLLSAGSDPLALNNFGRTPLHDLLQSASRLTFRENKKDVVSLCRLLLQNGASEILIGDISVFRRMNTPISLCRYIQQEMYPPFCELSWEERLYAMAGQTDSGWHNIPSLLQESFVTGSGIQPEVLHWVNHNRRSLLHCFAEGLARGSMGSGDETTLDDDIPLEMLEQFRTSKDKSILWRGIIRDFVSAGAPLHTVDVDNRTPFWLLIDTMRSYSSGIPLRRHNLNPISAIKMWLTDLFTCGVDLQKYGTEEYLLLNNFIRDRLEDRLWSSDYVDRLFLPRLINFSYGPNPDDWVFWFSEVTDQFAGDFWEMVEAGQNPAQETVTLTTQETVTSTMPGSWNEDSDSESTWSKDSS